MAVKVKLAGMLKSYLDGQDATDLPAGVSVREMILSLKMPVEIVALVLVNGKYQPKSYVALDGDSVTLYAVVGGG